jgi:Leucine-rich repeat (LRR) protein
MNPKEETKILSLIDTGEDINIRLAFQLIKLYPNGYTVTLFETLYNWLYKYDRIKKVKRIQTKISRILNDRFLLLLSGQNIRTLPESIGYCRKTQQLFLDDNRLKALPNSVSKLELVHDLHLSNNDFTTFPQVILELNKLKSIYFNKNLLKEIPQEINQLNNLQTLDFRNNRLTAFPKNVLALQNLDTLLLDDNCIKRLPETIIGLNKLSYLSLRNNPISENQVNYIRQQLPNCQVIFTPRVTNIYKRMSFTTTLQPISSWTTLGYSRCQPSCSMPFRTNPPTD